MWHNCRTVSESLQAWQFERQGMYGLDEAFESAVLGTHTIYGDQSWQWNLV